MQLREGAVTQFKIAEELVSLPLVRNSRAGNNCLLKSNIGIVVGTVEDRFVNRFSGLGWESLDDV
jgi:hypothetical protein